MGKNFAVIKRYGGEKQPDAVFFPPLQAVLGLFLVQFSAAGNEYCCLEIH